VILLLLLVFLSQPNPTSPPPLYWPFPGVHECQLVKGTLFLFVYPRLADPSSPPTLWIRSQASSPFSPHSIVCHFPLHHTSLSQLSVSASLCCVCVCVRERDISR